MVYKTRFTDAMNRYFLMVPDPWTETSLLQPLQAEGGGGKTAGITLQEVPAAAVDGAGRNPRRRQP